MRLTAKTLVALVLTFAAVSFAAALPVGAQPDPAAGWHGRAVVDRLSATELAAAQPLPSDWVRPVQMGTGFKHLGGSRRVRSVQLLLVHIGYRPGPVDGLFGPRTRDAVKWFQIKHGMRPDGIVEAPTLTELRFRAGESAQGREAPVADRPRPGGAAASGRPGSAPLSHAGSKRQARSHGDGAPSTLAIVALLLLVPVVVAAIGVAQRRVRRRPRAKPEPGPEPEPKSKPKPKPRVDAPRALGYVKTADRSQLRRHAAAIDQACGRRGWALAALVREAPHKNGGMAKRRGLMQALQQLSAGAESRLVVSRLEHLSRSPAHLRALLEWLQRHEVGLVALEPVVDTTTPEGRLAAKALLARIERARGAGRPRRSGRSGRPGGGERLDSRRPVGSAAGSAADGRTGEPRG